MNRATIAVTVGVLGALAGRVHSGVPPQLPPGGSRIERQLPVARSGSQAATMPPGSTGREPSAGLGQGRARAVPTFLVRGGALPAAARYFVTPGGSSSQ